MTLEEAIKYSFEGAEKKSKRENMKKIIIEIYNILYEKGWL